MFRAGVPLLAGTDTPGPERIPGFSLAEELELLVRAGLPPLAALQTATREPARFLGMADSLGTVEQGKVADLVLLGGDPLADIRNVHQVRAVILGGRYISSSQLDSLRGSVRSLVAAWRDSVAKQRPDSMR
jgi:imidazolonepropionase-like amidohydrolase